MIASSIAASGMAAASARFEQSAVRTARAPLENLETEMVERIGARTAFFANAGVMRTADDMAGALLDILA
ncbi:MAG: flagellar hook protein FlgE [Alphaproteobacteria bacterium]|nr:flagellar hook protein FlgE [Alphaproteobacteria bacterium]MBU2378812.1 flagellar hook protein FlgE [Alphaproteobacteria bacterium]